jgi:hypothetical protein
VHVSALLAIFRTATGCRKVTIEKYDKGKVVVYDGA